MAMQSVLRVREEEGDARLSVTRVAKLEDISEENDVCRPRSNHTRAVTYDGNETRARMLLLTSHGAQHNSSASGLYYPRRNSEGRVRVDGKAHEMAVKLQMTPWVKAVTGSMALQPPSEN